MERHQNESQATESIKEAKAICSQVTLDAQALCFATIKEAKSICSCITLDTKAICSCVTLDAKALCLAMIKEAKMTWACTIPRGQSYLLYSLQGCWDLEGLPGWVTPKGIWQNHVGLGGAGHLRGEQKSCWLPLCLLGWSVCQPCRVQGCAGGFLPHVIGQSPPSHPFAL